MTQRVTHSLSVSLRLVESLKMYIYRQIDRLADWRMVGRTDGWTDGGIDGLTDTQIYSGTSGCAFLQLKMKDNSIILNHLFSSLHNNTII